MNPSTPAWTLRPARDEDRAFLHRVFLSSWHRALAGANWPPELVRQVLDHQFEAQDLSYRKDFPNATFDLVLLEGEPIGRLYLDRRPDELVLMEMTLLPEFQNRGLGTALVHHVQERAREHELPVGLHVEHWNPDARRLYERLEFVVVADIGTHWKMRWTPVS